ncbi:3-oxo-tetronate kinase [Microbacterium sp. gxy059]|uniref:3-oxo-tetronate kinase n=1 Tax=Microbacterium sp. gxy059 TaxID=2957199 RepID=UPI003D999ECF
MLGAIADDFTGATDLATMLRRSGHRTTVVIEDGGPSAEQIAGSDAVVVALKSRTAAADEAAADSVRALRRLRGWGATRFYAKYCSTFDSTDAGNIGPVLDALRAELGASRCVVVPSLPANGRTVYSGHLFVNGELLEDSPMRHHPLTPMTRSRVADLLRPQTADHAVDEVPHSVVRAGADALRSALDALAAPYAVVDAISDEDLVAIGRAVQDDPLVSGGSGLALGLPGPGAEEDDWRPPEDGRSAVLCGSVSRTTLAQIDVASRTQPVRRIDLDGAVADPEGTARALAIWVLEQDADARPVVCAARDRSDVRALHGGSEVAPLVERILAETARRLVAAGVRRLVVAGGESSGAVVRSLGIESMRIGPELAPGVCWSLADASGIRIAIALKSGNFGDDDLFVSAWERLS